MGEKRGRRRKIASLAIAVVFASTLLTGVVPTTHVAQAALPGDIAIECHVGGLFPLNVPAWACWADQTSAHFWGWWVNPTVTPNPFVAYGPGEKTDMISSEGAVDGGDMESTLQFIMGVGSRGTGQQSNTPGQFSWPVDAVTFRINKTVVNGTGDSATDWVKAQINAPNACPAPGALTARIGYVMKAVGENPETVAAADGRDCSLQSIVESRLDPATGAFGGALEETIWSVFAIETWGRSGDVDLSKTADYIKGQALPGGGWGDGALDPVLSGRAIMALLPLDVDAGDAAIDAAMDALAAVQNDDGGFGYPTSPATTATVPTALVHAALRATEARGKIYYSRFEKGEGDYAGRVGIEIALGITLQVQETGCLEDGRFYIDVAGAEGCPGGDVGAEIVPLTLPSSAAIFYFYFWDPVDLADSPVNPDVTPDDNVPTATSATPNVTG